ncbi:MAG: lipopolysaccharide biosynthesis protein [Candidatus Zhuqueibacterota bacterium]
MNEFELTIKNNIRHVIYQRLSVPIFNFLITIYVVKKLSVQEYGIYNLLYAIIGYLTLLTSMGILNILQRFVPEYNKKSEYSVVKRLVRSSLFIRLLLSIVFILIIVLLGPNINHLLKVDTIDYYIRFFSLGIILFLLIQVLEVSLGSLLLNKYILISYFITTLIRGALVYLLLDQNYGIMGLLIAETVFYSLLAVLLFASYYLGFARKKSSVHSDLPFKRLLRYGGFSYFDEVGETILDVKTDFFVISTFLGPTMVGLYAFADKIMEMVSKILPFKLLKSLIRPVFFSKFAETDGRETLNTHFNFLVKFIAFFAFPVFLGIIVLGDKIIVFLFDEKYLSALKILWVMAGFMMINSFQFPLQLVVQAKEKVEISFISKIFSIYNLVGDILVVRPFGIMGVGLVTCSARLFQNLFVFFRIKKIALLKIEFSPLFKIFINSLATMLVLFLLRNWITNATLLILILIGGGVVYLFFSIINKSFFPEEREKINNMLPRPIFLF